MDRQEEFVLRTLEERDIRFVRLWFTDVLGYLKSVAVAPAELEGAFAEGIGFDGSAIEGFARVYEADMIAKPDYATSASRSKNRDALNAEIDQHTVKRGSAEWIDRFNTAGVPSGPIYSIDQMFADPQVKHVRMAQPVKKSKLTLVGQPFTLSRTPSKLDAPPPELGQHTSAVLKQLGYSAKQIAALRKANAI